MGKQYQHVRDPKTGEVKVIEIPRVSRGINPDTSSGTMKDGPLSRLTDAALKRLGR
jgi:hypothetical protein